MPNHLDIILYKEMKEEDDLDLLLDLDNDEDIIDNIMETTSYNEDFREVFPQEESAMEEE